jgi:ABC-type nitrate/sulfonate/bicarbonate transport system substrate-binding protein
MAIFDFDHEGEIPHYRFAECVVSLATDDEPQDYLMANASLIAAAPELLEALTSTLDEIGFWLSQQKPELRDKLVSAIAKALGEPQ